MSDFRELELAVSCVKSSVEELKEMLERIANEAEIVKELADKIRAGLK